MNHFLLNGKQAVEELILVICALRMLIDNHSHGSGRPSLLGDTQVAIDLAS